MISCKVCGGNVLPLADQFEEPLCDVCNNWAAEVLQVFKSEKWIRHFVAWTKVRAYELLKLQN